MIFCVFSSCRASSPERKRRVSSRVTGKREPSPPPSRPSSLRQSVPLKQPPQLVNGKADTPAAGRTRSAARHSTYTPPSLSSSQTASNTQSTAGERSCVGNVRISFLAGSWISRLMTLLCLYAKYKTSARSWLVELPGNNVVTTRLQGVIVPSQEIVLHLIPCKPRSVFTLQFLYELNEMC